MNSVISVKPLSRVEGHGTVNVFLAGRHVEEVRFTLYESPRLFEALLLGKRYTEIPEIICRICSLCSTVHRVTALLALEKALDIEVGRQTSLYRELIVQGGHIQSHALHLFCLVLPDIEEVDGLAELAREAPELFATGLKIKAVGNAIQESVGGRLIHPVTLQPGGMGRPPGRKTLLKLKDELQDILPETIGISPKFRQPTPATAGSPLPSTRYVALEPGAVTFFGSRIRAADRSFDVNDYRRVMVEECPRHGNAKRTLVDGTPVTAGALARINLGTKFSGEAALLTARYRNEIHAADIRANNLCQAVELVYCIERSLELIELLLHEEQVKESPPATAPRQGAGAAAMEAPRGLLIHSYGFDGTGRCTTADVITPTALNQAAIERDLLALARSMEGIDVPEMKHQLEMLVRAYDPCISCAVHFVHI